MPLRVTQGFIRATDPVNWGTRNEKFGFRPRLRGAQVPFHAELRLGRICPGSADCDLTAAIAARLVNIG